MCKIQGLPAVLEQILWYPAEHYPSCSSQEHFHRPANTQPLRLGQLVTPALCALFFPQGKYILTPSPITYAEEQLFHFFGQLLGIAIRADVPLPLDLLPSFWKTLVGEPLDPDVDLQEADILTYNYVKKFENVGPCSLFPPFSQDSPTGTLLPALGGGCRVVFMGAGLGGVFTPLGCRVLPPVALEKFPALPCCRPRRNYSF